MVSQAWQRWVADNLVRGAASVSLVDGLIDGGVPRPLAEQTVSSASASPALAVARDRDRRAERWAMVARLQASVSGVPSSIERLEAPDAAGLFGRFWQGSRPAVFTDIVPRWRARWTPSWLRERYGEVTVEACVGRQGDPRPDANWQEYRVSMTLAEYIDRMAAVEASNDLYLIANNRNTARPELRPLWDDVVLPPGWFDHSRLATGSALWLGPAGTVTPLHHDTSNILLCQIHGRKDIVLAPPWESALLGAAEGVYSGLDVEQARAAGATLLELTLRPGEALFIPVGWWHDVRARDVSVSLAINAFDRANVFDGYRPGSA